VLKKEIKIVDLQKLLDKSIGKDWVDLEPETILLELEFPDYLVAEKLYILKTLNLGLNEAISIPEVLVWTTSVCNNENVDFEIFNLPNCLELAWTISQVKELGDLISQKFQPTGQLKEVIGYMLREEGFSKPVYPFDFVPEELLVEGQLDIDTKNKELAIKAYIKYMETL
jgi:hypothetical protein